MLETLTAFLQLLAKPIVQFTSMGERLFWPFLVGTVVSVIVALVLIKRMSLKTAFADAFNPKIYTHPSAINDYKYTYINAFLVLLILTPLANQLGGWVSESTEKWVTLVGLQGIGGASNAWVMVLYSVLIVLMMDLGIYWGHRIQHAVPWLWEFHKMHHSAEVLTPITVYRMHPMDDVIGFVGAYGCSALVDGAMRGLFTGQVAPMSLMGMNIVMFLFYLCAFHLRHSHVWLDYGPFWSRIFNSPAQHQIHHSIAPRHWNKNFSLVFSVWDEVFGTNYIPKREEKLAFGLTNATEYQDYSTVLKMYLMPFHRVFGQFLNYQWTLPRTVVALAISGMLMLGGYAWYKMPRPSVYLDALTWQEVQNAVASGKTTVILPMAETLPSGPHLPIGKQTLIIKDSAGRIAKSLGNALVAPVVVLPTGGSDQTYLMQIAQDFKQSGFKTICLLRETASNTQDNQASKALADTLTRQWQADGVKVVAVTDYNNTGLVTKWLRQKGYTQGEIGDMTQANNLPQTAELMAVSPQAVRNKLLQKTSEPELRRLGMTGDPLKATANLGNQLLDLKVQAALKQIQQAINAPVLVQRNVTGHL